MQSPQKAETSMNNEIWPCLVHNWCVIDVLLYFNCVAVQWLITALSILNVLCNSTLIVSVLTGEKRSHQKSHGQRHPLTGAGGRGGECQVSLPRLWISFQYKSTHSSTIVTHVMLYPFNVFYYLQYHLHNMSRRPQEDTGHQASFSSHDHQESQEVFHLWGPGRVHTHGYRTLCVTWVCCYQGMLGYINLSHWLSGTRR